MKITFMTLFDKFRKTGQFWAKTGKRSLHVLTKKGGHPYKTPEN